MFVTGDVSILSLSTFHLPQRQQDTCDPGLNITLNNESIQKLSDVCGGRDRLAEYGVTDLSVPDDDNVHLPALMVRLVMTSQRHAHVLLKDTDGVLVDEGLSLQIMHHIKEGGMLRTIYVPL